MALKRYYPSKDTSIANYDPGVGTLPISSSNVGASEILNLYSVVENSASAHILVDFDVVVLPDPSANIVLKMFDAQHAETLPVGYRVIVQDLDVDWTEGNGHDLDYYSDLGAANWVSATLTTTWAEPGAIQPTAGVSFSFDTGHEDLTVDVTSLVTGTLWPSRGYVISVDPAFSGTDLYIKKFHSRHTHFQKKRPYLEVRWNDSTGSAVTTVTKYVTGSGLWSGSYFDEPWFVGQTGPPVPVEEVNPTGSFILKMPNLKKEYEVTEEATLRVDVIKKDWNEAAVAVATSAPPVCILTDIYYRIVDDVSGEVLVPFGTGSTPYTKLSYDRNGNYFWFPMCNLPSGAVCSIDFMSGSDILSSKQFKFRMR